MIFSIVNIHYSTQHIVMFKFPCDPKWCEAQMWHYKANYSSYKFIFRLHVGRLSKFVLECIEDMTSNLNFITSQDLLISLLNVYLKETLIRGLIK